MPVEIERKFLVTGDAWRRDVSRSVRMASLKAPTPGRTIRSADRISSGTDIICAGAPTCSKPFWTERRFAMP